MKEYLEILKKQFDYTYIYATKHSRLLYSESSEKDDLQKYKNKLCELLVNEIQENYKKYLLPFNNNIELFKSVLETINSPIMKEYEPGAILSIYKNIEDLYTDNLGLLNKELEIKLYTNLFELSFITGRHMYIKYMFDIFNNKNNLLLFTEFILNKQSSFGDNYPLSYDFLHLIEYLLQIRIFFKDENSYLSYIMKFINKLIKEEKDFNENDIKEYLNEFIYSHKINDELIDEIKDIEESTDYQSLINSFNNKEKMHNDIEHKINSLNENYNEKIDKLKLLKEELSNIEINDIEFYDNNTTNFSELDYSAIKDYIKYLTIEKNQSFNNSIYNILHELSYNKSIFINVGNNAIDKINLINLFLEKKNIDVVLANQNNNIYDTLTILSKLLNTEVIKINYNDIKLLKDINLDKDKKYLICINLSDKYELYNQQDILYLEDKFKEDNYRIIYINENRLNNNTFDYEILYKCDNSYINKEIKTFMNNICKYIKLNHYEINMFIKLYESKLFSLEEIFELIFKNKEIDNSILNENYTNEITIKFIDYILNNKINLTRIKK